MTSGSHHFGACIPAGICIAPFFPAYYRFVASNNIGISAPGSVEEVSEADWDRVLAVNLKPMLFCSKYAMPYMRQRGGGAIINIASVAGMRGHGIVAYAASKGGAIAMARTMAVQHAQDRIRVNCIAPGPVYTPMVAEHMNEEQRQARRTSVPLEIEGTAWDVAWAAVYLASDEARWVTGVLLPVDGGIAATSRQRYRSQDEGSWRALLAVVPASDRHCPDYPPGAIQFRPEGVQKCISLGLR